MTKERSIVQTKVDRAEAHHVTMKGCNKVIRSKKMSDDEKAAKLATEYNRTETEIRKLMTPEDGRVGYPTWMLSNNTANIRRMKQRVIALKTKETTPTSEIGFDRGVIIDNAIDDRVQIGFYEKPDADTIAELNFAGWRWAPSVEMWQRKRTPAALTSAKQIVGVL